MNKLEQIRALADKVDGDLPSRKEGVQTIVRLELTRVERNLIADALMVLYGVESRAALSSTERETQ